MNLSQDEILKLNEYDLPLEFKNKILNAIQSHSGGEAVGYGEPVAVADDSVSRSGYKELPNGDLIYFESLNYRLTATSELLLPDGTELFTYQPDQSARIKELEAEKIVASRLIAKTNQANYELAKQITELQATNAKLVEQVRVMREALQYIDETESNSTYKHGERLATSFIIKTALASMKAGE